MTNINIKKLATLARIEVSDADSKKLAAELPSIVDFVGEIQKVTETASMHTGEHYNVFREDEHPHESALYTDALLKEMPDTEKGYLKVRQILSSDE